MSFFIGFSYPFRSIFFFLKHPSLFKYGIMQVIITTIAFLILSFLLFFYGINHFSNWIGGILPTGEWYWTIFSYIIKIIFITILIGISFLLFLLISNIISAPINSALAEKVWEITKGTETKKKSGILIQIINNFKSCIPEIKKLLMFVILQIFLLALNLIPVVGSIIYTIFNIMFSIFFITFDFFSYAMEKEGLRFRYKIKKILFGGLIVYGFGIASFILLLIPLINFIIVPLCIIGGTRLYCEKLYNTKKL